MMSINFRLQFGTSLSSCEGGDEADLDSDSNSNLSGHQFYDNLIGNSDDDVDADLDYHPRLNQYENESSGLTKIRNVVFHKYDSTANSPSSPVASEAASENDYLKLKLSKLLESSSKKPPLTPNTNSSAYDTCSQMSSTNDSHSITASCSSSGSANNKTASSTTSGNTSGDYNQFSNDANENFNSEGPSQGRHSIFYNSNLITPLI